MDETFAPFTFSSRIQPPVQELRLKRLFDIFFSFSFLILFLPVLLFIVLLIFLTSKGKIFYSQERVGLGGRIFQCYKFRTMYEDAERRLHTILEEDSEKKKEWENSFKLKIDPRVTRVGNWLRKTSLDELPQFWNVLKGDLSIVGPRPLVKKELELFYGVKAYKILQVRPGITGLWQVSGRNDLSYEKRVLMDEEYIDKRSYLFDMVLILKTVPAILSRRGAY